MNHIDQRVTLDKQLQLYKDFMTICPTVGLPRLLKEMMKIHYRIEKINEMNFEELLQPVIEYEELKQSRMNFINPNNPSLHGKRAA